MEKVVNTAFISVEPQTSELSSGLSEKVGDSILKVIKLAAEEISQQILFSQGKDTLLTNRDKYQNIFFHETTTSRKGQVPEQPTQMQEKRKAKFANKAPISGRPLRFPDSGALPPAGAWPTLDINPSDIKRSFHKKGKISTILEL